MKNEELYERIDKDEYLTDSEKRKAFFAERDEEEERQCYYCGQESCDCDML